MKNKRHCIFADFMYYDGSRNFVFGVAEFNNKYPLWLKNEFSLVGYSNKRKAVIRYHRRKQSAPYLQTRAIQYQNGKSAYAMDSVSIGFQTKLHKVLYKNKKLKLI